MFCLALCKKTHCLVFLFKFNFYTWILYDGISLPMATFGSILEVKLSNSKCNFSHNCRFKKPAQINMVFTCDKLPNFSPLYELYWSVLISTNDWSTDDLAVSFRTIQLYIFVRISHWPLPRIPSMLCFVKGFSLFSSTKS